MTASRPPLIYLDQCILSALQHESPHRTRMKEIVERLKLQGFHFVTSDIHIQEIKQSGQQERFITILGEMQPLFIESINYETCTMQVKTPEFSALLKDAEAPLSRMGNSLNDIVAIMNFARGGLDGVATANDLKIHLASNFEDALQNLVESDWPDWAKDRVNRMVDSQTIFFESLELESIRSEAVPRIELFESSLPNYAQIDEMSARDAVDFLLNQIPEPDRTVVRKQYPRDFWKSQKREVGTLVGFAFLLFELGLARNPRTKNNTLAKRTKHYLSQFRDCQHIEYASHCDIFLTRDKGAARLSAASFGYSGAGTHTLLYSDKERMIVLPH